MCNENGITEYSHANRGVFLYTHATAALSATTSAIESSNWTVSNKLHVSKNSVTPTLMLSPATAQKSLDFDRKQGTGVQARRSKAAFFAQTSEVRFNLGSLFY